MKRTLSQCQSGRRRCRRWLPSSSKVRSGGTHELVEVPTLEKEEVGGPYPTSLRHKIGDHHLVPLLICHCQAHAGAGTRTRVGAGVDKYQMITNVLALLQQIKDKIKRAHIHIHAHSRSLAGVPGRFLNSFHVI